MTDRPSRKPAQKRAPQKRTGTSASKGAAGGVRRGRTAKLDDDDRRARDSERPKPRASASRGRPTGKGGSDTRTGGRGGDKRTSSRGGDKRTSGRGADKRTSGRGGDKRTSKNSDDRNPTRSGTQYPPRKYKATEEPAPEPKERSSLRKVAGKHQPKKATRASKSTSTMKAGTKPAKGAAKKPGPKRGRTRDERSRIPNKAPRRRRGRTTEATEELARLAGRNARDAQNSLARAAEAFTAGRERDAARILRPLRDAYPDASAVRELLGLCHYRMGQYPAAAKELEAFVEITDSVEQHPVLMDCMRAAGKYKKVEELWEELATASPSSALVTEGRIVLAGTRADRGRLKEAIATLDRGASSPQRVQEHHLRMWYALADLYERAGDIPHARELFLKVRKNDPAFADVAERLSILR